MAVTTVPLHTPIGSYPTLPVTPDSADLVGSPLTNTTDGFRVPFGNGRMLLHVRNVNAGAQTITINSVVDDKNRLGNIATYSIGAGESAVFGPFNSAGWKDSNGYLTGTGSVVTDLIISAINI